MQADRGLALKPRACLLLIYLAWAPGLGRAYSEGVAYLKIPQGARSSGMGGAVAARRLGVEGLWYSPAAIHTSSLFELSVSHLAWIGETSNDFLAASVRLSPRHSIGVYGNVLSSGDTYRDTSGNESGSFLNSASVLGMAWGVDWGPAGLGLGIKEVSESFDGTTSRAIGLDGGLQFAALENHLRLGVNVQNIGSYTANNYSSYSSSYSGQTYSSVSGSLVYLPTLIHAGFALENVFSGFNLGVEYRFLPFSYESGVCGGLEYEFNTGPLALALRGGYDMVSAKLGGLAGMSLGTGARFDSLKLDFAWVPQGPLGNPYRLSLSWLYGSEPKRQESARRRPVTAAAAAIFEAPPTDPPALLRAKARENEDTGQLEEALRIYVRLSQDAPNDARWWKAQGRILRKMGRRDDAIDAYRRAAELVVDPEFEEWLKAFRAK